MLEWLWGKAINEKALVDMIAISLYKDGIDELVKRSKKSRNLDKVKPKTTDGHAYIAKILSEEIEKQFPDWKRPFVELVSNAIDARPVGTQGFYPVDVNVGADGFRVSDTGESMSLRKVLSTLMIPFSTDKDALETIGMFGVGFLSNLQYCLNTPGKSQLVVDTCDGEEAYKLTFSSTGPSVKDIRCRIERAEKSKVGTTVRILGYPMNGDELRSYLEQYFDFFDSDRARIRVNGSALNYGSFGVRKLPVRLKANGTDVDQEARIMLDADPLKKRQKLGLYSQGVFVRSEELKDGEMRVDFPSAVEIVEGRNQLRIDGNYWAVVDRVYDALIEYARENSGKARVTKNMREMVAHFSRAIGRQLLHGQEFKDVLFPDVHYMVEDGEFPYDDLTQVTEFFGDEISGVIYAPETAVAKSVWHECFGGKHDMVKKETRVVADGNVQQLQKYCDEGGKPIHNLDAIKDAGKLVLVEFDYSGGVSPFISDDDTIYLNRNHPFLYKQGDFPSHYGIKTTHMRATGMTEKDIEDRVMT